MHRIGTIALLVLSIIPAAQAKLQQQTDLSSMVAEAVVDVPLYFAAGVVALTLACDSPRGIFPQIPDCDVSWREVTATE